MNIYCISSLACSLLFLAVAGIVYERPQPDPAPAVSQPMVDHYFFYDAVRPDGTTFNGVSTLQCAPLTANFDAVPIERMLIASNVRAGDKVQSLTIRRVERPTDDTRTAFHVVEIKDHKVVSP